MSASEVQFNASARPLWVFSITSNLNAAHGLVRMQKGPIVVWALHLERVWSLTASLLDRRVRFNSCISPFKISVTGSYFGFPGVSWWNPCNQVIREPLSNRKHNKITGRFSCKPMDFYDWWQRGTTKELTTAFVDDKEPTRWPYRQYQWLAKFAYLGNIISPMVEKYWRSSSGVRHLQYQWWSPGTRCWYCPGWLRQHTQQREEGKYEHGPHPACIRIPYVFSDEIGWQPSANPGWAWWWHTIQWDKVLPVYPTVRIHL